MFIRQYKNWCFREIEQRTKNSKIYLENLSHRSQFLADHQFRILPHRRNVILEINRVKKRIVSIMPPGVLPVNYMQRVNKLLKLHCTNPRIPPSHMCTTCAPPCITMYHDSVPIVFLHVKITKKL